MSVTGAVLATLTTLGSSLAARSARLGGIGGLACAGLSEVVSAAVRQVAARSSGCWMFMGKLCDCSGWLARVLLDSAGSGVTSGL